MSTYRSPYNSMSSYQHFFSSLAMLGIPLSCCPLLANLKSLSEGASPKATFFVCWMIAAMAVTFHSTLIGSSERHPHEVVKCWRNQFWFNALSWPTFVAMYGSASSGWAVALTALLCMWGGFITFIAWQAWNNASELRDKYAH